jgi:REP element-mobilizing transposase RayT
MDDQFDFDFDRLLADVPPEDFYAQVIIAVLNHAPLLQSPRLARIAAQVIESHADSAPGQLWGYLVMPDYLRLVIGPTNIDGLDTFVDGLKDQSGARLIDAIRRADDDSLDVVLRYSPVWGGAIYEVWQAGYHRQLFWTEYKLSNTLYEMGQIPVTTGLVRQPEEWPYLRVGGEEA